MALTPKIRPRLSIHYLTLVTGLLMGCLGTQDNSVQGSAGSTPREVGPIIINGNNVNSQNVAATATPAKETCDQGEMNDIADPFERFLEAFECGDEIFGTEFNELDGVGANVGGGQRFTRIPRSDLRTGTEWFNHTPARVTGPNASSCADCHRQGAEDGSGPAGSNVHRDPRRLGQMALFIQRNTPHVFGLGTLQVLAEEVTTDLQNQLTAARARLVGGVTSTTQAFSSKGISFGTGTVTATTVTGVVGIDADLIVKPYQWKGVVKTVREFMTDAGHNELGMDAVEITGQGVDGDGDGVANELTIGDISAVAIYQAGQPRPTSKLELNALGLLEEPLTADQIAAINRGQTVFNTVAGAPGCGRCHIPQLTINSPIFREPSSNPLYRFATFPAGIDPISVGVNPAAPISFNLTTDQPDNRFPTAGGGMLGSLESNGSGGAIARVFTDLKFHDMGAGLAETTDDTARTDGTGGRVGPNGVTGARLWMTRTLWGTGNTGPWLHDGRATTLMSAIMEHGGEATAVRDAVRALPTADKQALVAFLDNMVLFKSDAAPPEPPPTPTLTATVATNTDWGAGYCQTLTVRNTGTVDVTTWSVVINTGASTITQLWNGNRSGSTGNVTVSSAFSWQAIPAGGSTNATGWCANRNAPNNGALASVVSASGS